MPLLLKLSIPLFLFLSISCASRRPAPVIVRNIPYVENGHERQTGDLYLPAGTVSRDEAPDQKALPLVVVIHGGGWTNRDRGDMVKFGERLSASGYAAFNIVYRLAPGDRHPAQLEDVRAAIAFAETLSKTHPVDPARIALLGYSAGGHLALLAAATADSETSPIRAVVAGGAPTMLWIYPNSPLITKLIGGTPEEYPDAYAYASVIPGPMQTRSHWKKYPINSGTGWLWDIFSPSYGTNPLGAKAVIFSKNTFEKFSFSLATRPESHYEPRSPKTKDPIYESLFTPRIR
jgi:acetyl esterase/lipase